jgi:VIT1/CCC1 family predicted Fe2+/Mn2+ transporter
LEREEAAWALELAGRALPERKRQQSARKRSRRQKKTWAAFVVGGLVPLLLLGVNSYVVVGMALCVTLLFAGLVASRVRYNRTVWPAL